MSDAARARGDVHPLGSWTDGLRETVLVIIADRDHIDRGDVESRLDACLAAGTTHGRPGS